MTYFKDGKVNELYARLNEWLEDMGVPSDQREQYAKDIIEDVEQNATVWHNEYAKSLAQ